MGNGGSIVLTKAPGAEASPEPPIFSADKSQDQLEEIKTLYTACRRMSSCVLSSAWKHCHESFEQLSKLVARDRSLSDLVSKDTSVLDTLPEWLSRVIKLNEIDSQLEAPLDDDDDIEQMLGSGAAKPPPPPPRSSCPHVRETTTEHETLAKFFSKVYFAVLDLSFQRELEQVNYRHPHHQCPSGASPGLPQKGHQSPISKRNPKVPVAAPLPEVVPGETRLSSTVPELVQAEPNPKKNRLMFRVAPDQEPPQPEA